MIDVAQMIDLARTVQHDDDNIVEDDSDAEFVQLYAKMSQTLSVMGVVGQNPAALLSVQIPGVVVPTDLDPDDLETEYFLSNLLNMSVECNYVLTPKAGLTSDVYKLILDGKETPLVELTPEQKRELRDAEDTLFDAGGRPTHVYATYLAFQEAYLAAQDALCTAEATQENGGPAVPGDVRDRFDKAGERWRQEGFKHDVRAALATLRQLQPREPYVYWDALADRFAASTKRLPNGSEFQHVDSLPRYRDWFRDELWTSFTFDEKDFRRQRRSGGTGMRGRACCCGAPAPNPTGDVGMGDPFCREHGVLLAASKGPHAPLVRGPKLNAASGSIRLRCDIKRIVILRPWMDVAVFSSRMWKWSPQSIGRGIVISSGGSVAGNQTATGVLPVLPSTVLLAKEIEVSTTSRETDDWIRTMLGSGHRVRCGPFLLTESRPQWDGTGVVASGPPQVFGCISTVIGKCPNPDPLVPWPS